MRLTRRITFRDVVFRTSAFHRNRISHFVQTTDPIAQPTISNDDGALLDTDDAQDDRGRFIKTASCEKACRSSADVDTPKRAASLAPVHSESACGSAKHLLTATLNLHVSYFGSCSGKHRTMSESEAHRKKQFTSNSRSQMNRVCRADRRMHHHRSTPPNEPTDSKCLP